jgi:hypothetical protein
LVEPFEDETPVGAKLETYKRADAKLLARIAREPSPLKCQKRRDLPTAIKTGVYQVGTPADKNFKLVLVPRNIRTGEDQKPRGVCVPRLAIV